jgi:hypothetical protein
LSIKAEKNLKTLIQLSKKMNKPAGTKNEKNSNALKFKENIEICSIDEPGAQYECVYKNLIRDLRLYF